MSFHTTAESYLKELEKNNIPKDYGGEAPPLLTLHRNNVKDVQSKREYLLEEEKLRCDEKKRIGKSKKENSEISQKSFQKLEID